MSRTIVVGDIHGCYDELVEMLETVSFGPDDRVICVGDLVTKGPKNREVLELFMTDPRFSSVIGNHDLALRRKWHGEKVKLKPSQKATHKELKKDKEKYLPFLNKLPFTIDLGTHLVVHAGLRPGVPLYSQTSEDMTLLRTLGKNREGHDGTPWYEVYDGEKVVLFGHWPSAVPRRGPRAIGLDTGCVYGYDLTAYIIEKDKFITIHAHETYEAR
jgi:diadenosine tetraphosphatase ApaH/serine/threonine PP2A family protein phosphatase